MLARYLVIVAAVVLCGGALLYAGDRKSFVATTPQSTSLFKSGSRELASDPRHALVIKHVTVFHLIIEHMTVFYCPLL